MDVTPVDGSTYFGITPAAKKSELDMMQFVKLLTVQLQNQDPLSPMNDRDFFAQMAQLGQVQGLDQVNKSLEVSQAAALMGKNVTAVVPQTQGDPTSGGLVSGVVKQLTLRSGQYYLQLQAANGGMVEVSMAGIQSVSDQ